MSCVTLLSDLGLQDASVAIAKGVIMQYTPLPLIDISHEVMQFRGGEAAYLLASSYSNFPEGTVHLVLFDIFSVREPKLTLTTYKGYYFLAPDNGIIPMALDTVPASFLCYSMKKDDTYITWLHQAGAFIQQLQRTPGELPGLPGHDLVTGPGMSKPQITDAELICDVLHIDHYENVIINLRKEAFETLRKGRTFRLQFMLMEEVDEISNGYHDVREGIKLCRFNSNGYMEICINRGKAASLFGLRQGSKLNNIKIIFE